MAKGEFAMYVKQHYEKVRHIPARERLKALGEMYRGGAKPAHSTTGGEKKRAHRSAGLGEHMGKHPMLGGEFAPATLNEFKTGNPNATIQEFKETDDDDMANMEMSGIGGKLHKRKQHSKKKQHSRGGDMPLNLVPPSVPVDRASTAGVNVPGALYSGVKVFNPHEQEIALKRRSEPKMKQEQGTFIIQGASQSQLKPTDLKTILKSFGMTPYKGMRNREMPQKLSKAQLAKIYKHAVATHGEVRGGDMLDKMALEYGLS
jgi:hypothetical protein